MYKLVQPSGKSVGNIMTSITAQPVKLIKTPDTTTQQVCLSNLTKKTKAN